MEIKYILSQQEHHKKKKFKEEYLVMLANNEAIFNNEYLFDIFDGINELY
jgi:hypothetical protein